MSTHEHGKDCREMFARLSEYLDVELPPDTCREMEAHIAGCGPCAAFTESLRRTIELCRGFRPQELPAAIARDARQKLRQAYQKMLDERRR
jgi:RNA polymerase sigma-70 factor (ECF subfamily)